MDGTIKNQQLFSLPVLPGNLPISVSIAVCIALGVWFIESYELIPVLILIFINTAIFFYKKIKSKQKNILYSLFCCAFFCGAFSSLIQENSHLSFSQATGGKPFAISGYIKDINKLNGRDFCYQTLITATEFTRRRESLKVKRCILMFSKEKPNIEVADFVHIDFAMLSKSQNNSFGKYLIKEGIYGTIFTNSPKIKTVKRPKISLSRWLWHKKNTLFLLLEKKTSSQTFPLFSAIFLGNKSASLETTSNIKKSFLLWGISHYLARSGLHLVLFLLLWSFLFSLLPVNIKTRNLLFFFISFVLFFLTWISTSFIRAFYVFVLYKLCSFLNLQTNFIHVLSLVTIYILIFNPAQLFFLDFQLSFGLSYALAFLGHLTLQKQ